MLTLKQFWQKQFASMGDWSARLADCDDPQRLEILRRAIEKGLPCGSEKYIQKLEKQLGGALKYRPCGRPKKEGD